MSELWTRTRSAGRAPRGHLVLVHGTLDESAGFIRLLEHLDQWDVTMYDRRGWGRSAALEVGTPQENTEDLIRIIAGLGSAVFVVGHSFGGSVALAAAASAPALINGVVAFEPPLPWLPWWPELAPWERIVQEAGEEHAAETMLVALLGEAGWERLPERLRLLRRSQSPRLVQEMALLREAEPEFDPLQLRVPVVVGAGEASLPHHRLVSRRLSQLLPNAVYRELPGCEHAAHVTHPAQFAELVSALEEVQRAS